MLIKYFSDPLLCWFLLLVPFRMRIETLWSWFGFLQTFYSQDQISNLFSPYNANIILNWQVMIRTKLINSMGLLSWCSTRVWELTRKISNPSLDRKSKEQRLKEWAGNPDRWIQKKIIRLRTIPVLFLFLTPKCQIISKART